MDWFGGNIIKLSGDGTKLFVHADRYNIDTNDNTSSNEGKLYIYTFSNNDWINLNSIEGTSNNHYMIFDASDDGTVFTIANQNENKVIVYNYDYSTDVYSVKGSEITGDSNFGQNVSLSGDGNNISIANNIANYYVYTYDTDNNNWVQKGSTVSSDQGRPNSSLKLNYDGSVFIYGNSSYNSYFVKTIIEDDDVSSVLRNFQNDGYQLKTAYYGTNDGTNLSDSSIYENLNSNKLLNINDYNKVRYDVHTFSGDYNNPDGGYQTTSYSNDIFKFDFDNGNNHELYDITGSIVNVYTKISGFFTPISTGNYRLIFNPTDDGVKIRMREFTTSTDIENDSSSEITLTRNNNLSNTNYFKYARFNFTGNYDAPVNDYNNTVVNTTNRMFTWNDRDNTNIDMNTLSVTGSGGTINVADYNTLTDDNTNYTFIRMEVVFSTFSDDEYYFDLLSDDGIRIKIVEFNDPVIPTSLVSDWDSLANIDESGQYDSETNWEGHGPARFRYTISLQKHKIYKAYMEYAQGEGGYAFGYRVHRSGDSTYRTFEDTFQLYDTEATFDADGQSDTAGVWTDKESFSGGGSRSDIGNIYLHNTNTYEFLIEFAQGGGGGEFNFYAENTDENFTPSPFNINTEFVSLVNLKSKFEVLNELINTKFKYDVYNSPTLDDLTYVKTHYKNELLSWTGTANSSITNLSLLTGDLGNEYVTIIITGYFTPVETNNYIFRFLENDDQVSLNIVEYGNDIDSGSIALSNNTSDAILLESTKIYEFKIQYRNGPTNYNFEPQVEVGNSGTFVDLYNTNIFDFKVYYDYNPLNSITSGNTNLNIYDPNLGFQKFTYLVFYKDGNVGKTKVYEYKTDVEGNYDWYQVGNDILGLETDGWGGFKSTLDKFGKQIATTDIRSGGGTLRILKHDPIGTSIRNFGPGSNIDSTCTILANNEKLYQGSSLFSPNENYELKFQEQDGNLVLYGHSEAFGFSTRPISDNQTTAYAVMEDGNLNIYDENGDHRYSFTSDSTSGVLALDNNGNLSIVESWIEWERFSGGGEQGFSIDFNSDGTVIAIGTKNFNNTLIDQGRTEIFQLNNQLTLASVNSLTTGSSTNISFNVNDGNITDNKTFIVSNIDDTTIGELRIISNTFNLYEGSTLTADISSLYDPDGTISITSYEWEISNSSDFNNYSTITSATNSSFTIPKDTESLFSYVGQYIRLKVVANNTDIFSEPKLVLNIEDEVTGFVYFTSNMNLILEDSILTAVTNINDVDNNKLVVDTNDVGSLN